MNNAPLSRSLFIALMLCLIVQQPSLARVLSNRSVVVDDNLSNILSDSDARTEFFEFCKAPTRIPKSPITRVYIKPGWHGFDQISIDDQALKEFISQAHDQSIEVYCLQGHSGWVLPRRRELGVQVVDGIIKFNKTADERQRFDGVLLDIRVHTMSIDQGHGIGWSLNAKPIWRSYTKLINRIGNRVRRHNKGLEQPLLLGITLPGEFPGKANSTSHYREVMDRVDLVWLICSADRKDVIAEQIQDEVTLAEETGRTIVLGLTITPAEDLPDLTERNTFFDNGHGYMENTIQGISERFADHDSLPEACLSSYTHARAMSD